jgi:hypothetical protein
MKTKLAFAFITLAVLGTAPAAEEVITCPLELPAEAMKITPRNDNWKPLVTSPLYLHDAAPIAGPPERQGIIMGKMEKRHANEWTERYNLDVGYPEGVWFQCAYGANNSHTLSKKLESSVKSCVVKGKVGTKLGQNIFEIKCH